MNQILQLKLIRIIKKVIVTLKDSLTEITSIESKDNSGKNQDNIK